jgi:CRP/FNR family transcriptional regulator, cyclic AMP receptor protein
MTNRGRQKPAAAPASPRRIETLLNEVPFFAGLRPEFKSLIGECGSNVQYAAGEHIFREGEQANDFYLIRHGSVSIEAYEPMRGPLSIQTIQSGDVLGWSWLFPPYRWHYDARAVTAVRATAFDGVCLRGKCDSDATLGYELTSRFAQTLVERLESTRHGLLSVFGDDGKA